MRKRVAHNNTFRPTIVLLAMQLCCIHFIGKTQANHTDQLTTGQLTDSVFCMADPSQSYAVYLPLTSSSSPMPVIYFFDAHGAGALPLRQYKTLADEYGFVLVGSNNSKNGNTWPTTENIWQQMFNDAQKRLPINSNRVYASGFSGGAKAAGYLALKYPTIKGIIANSAGLPDGVAANNFAFSITLLAGEGDMNMAGLVAFNNSLNSTTTLHRLAIFSGKHEWAPANTMALAFAGLQLDAMRQGLLAKNSNFVNEFVAGSKQHVDAFFTANQLIKATQECSFSTSVLNGLSEQEGWFKNKLAAIAGSAAYQKQLVGQQTLLATEQNMQAGFMQQFEQGSMQYWATTIGSLQTAAAAKTPNGMMHQRLVAWLSLAFYSITNQLLSSSQNEGARHFVDLYKLDDPTNSEAWYLSAVLFARAGKPQMAARDLLKAVSCGFTDKNRLEQQPEFNTQSKLMAINVIEQKSHVK